MTGRTRTTLLPACAVFAMAACDSHSRPLAEPGTPPGWPLQPGDVVTTGELIELLNQYPGWKGTGLLAACDTNRGPPTEPGTPDETIQIQFMGTREQRATRAPYSPVGWPLRRDDLVLPMELRELEKRFPGWNGIRAPFWVGDKVFGALILGDIDASMAKTRRAGRTVLVHRYWGHFPQKASYNFGRCDLPPHLRGEDLEEMRRLLYNPRSNYLVRSYRAEMLETWTPARWIEGYTGGSR